MMFSRKNLIKCIYIFNALIIFARILIYTTSLTLLFIFVWPFNRDLYRKFTYYISYSIYAHPVFLMRNWSKTKIKLYIDRDVYKNYLGKESAFVVSNHSFELDWCTILCVLDYLKNLGILKAYIKRDFLYVPLFGWMVYCIEYIFLSRNYKKDKVNMSKSLNCLISYRPHFWLLLYPEGTRFTPKKHELSLKYAHENNLKELKHHLIPRTKGFTSSIPILREKVPAVYDLVITYERTPPTIINTLNMSSFNIHMYLRRIPMEKLPKGEEELEKYLREMFQRKDKLIGSFKETQDFFKTSGIERYEPIEISKNSITFYHEVLIIFICWGSFLYFLSWCFTNGHILLFVSTILLLIIGYVVTEKLVENVKMGEIKD